MYIQLCIPITYVIKPISLLLLLGLELLSVIGIQAQPSIGGFNIYYGHLNNHTSVSDGTGTPEHAYVYAKNEPHLDFFGLAEHSNLMSSTEWATVKMQLIRIIKTEFLLHFMALSGQLS